VGQDYTVAGTPTADAMFAKEFIQTVLIHVWGRLAAVGVS